MWRCFSCKDKGNLYHIFRYYNRDDLISKYFGKRGSLDIRKQVKELLGKFDEKDSEKPVQTSISLPDSFSHNFKTHIGAKYLKKMRRRGLEKATIRSFKLGYIHDNHFMHRRIVIPIYENNRLVGYQGRTIRKNEKKKYLFCKGFDSKVRLFNIDSIMGGEVIICEGVFDVMTLHQWGYQAVAIFGLNMGPEKVYKLIKRGVNRITFALDGDEPAQEALKSLYDEVYPYFDKILNIRLPKNKDIDELSRKTFYKLHKNRKVVEKVEFFSKI